MSTKLMPGIGKSGKRRRAPSRLIFARESSAAAAEGEAGCRPEASSSVMVVVGAVGGAVVAAVVSGEAEAGTRGSGFGEARSSEL